MEQRFSEGGGGDPLAKLNFTGVGFVESSVFTGVSWRAGGGGGGGRGPLGPTLATPLYNHTIQTPRWSHQLVRPSVFWSLLLWLGTTGGAEVTVVPRYAYRWRVRSHSQGNFLS